MQENITNKPDTILRFSLADFFESVAEATTAAAQIAANWIIGELSAALHQNGLEIDASKVSATALAGLVDRIHDHTISGKIAKEVFEAMWSGGGSADDIIAAKGLQQITDSSAIDDIVDAVIAANPGQADQYRAGKDNPGQVNEAIKRRLDQP